MPKNALPVTRADNFAAWYQAVIAEAELAEESGVRGCMVIKPWGYGIWERIQRLLDSEIKKAGIENCYFPLFIPLSYFAKEADHVDGFAKEMAVVTHHRLKSIDGTLKPDPDSELEEPLVVRPTSETVIGAAMARWIQSWRDLPFSLNQWANVVRWEMRTRMFLRTSEFLWQEGHTAHASRDDALVETKRAIDMYADFAEGAMAMPVVVGEKPENERFPGADATWSIEAMMQDGKALQAGTSHYLGTTFAEAANIRFQDQEGEQQLCHTTSWGMSTRMIGGLIMVHGDDDGLRCPPQVAPHQIVIIPMLRGNDDDMRVLDYCHELRHQFATLYAFGEPMRVLLDKSAAKSQSKRWSWVKKGAPIIVEVGPRDVDKGAVAVIRRDKLYREDGKLDTQFPALDEFVTTAANTLKSIQENLYQAAKARLDSNIHRDIADFTALESFFDDNAVNPGWVEVQWAQLTGDELDRAVERLKALKLTFRNVPRDDRVADGTCFFTGEPAKEYILIGRAY